MQFRVLVSVEGSASFTVEVPDLEEATAIAQALVDNNSWGPEREDASYEIADVREARHE
jgi:hypothetical protein